MNQSVVPVLPAEKASPPAQRFLAVPLGIGFHLKAGLFAPRHVFDLPPSDFLDGRPNLHPEISSGLAPEYLLDRAKAIAIVAEKNAPTLEWLQAWDGHETTWPNIEADPNGDWWAVIEIDTSGADDAVLDPRAEFRFVIASPFESQAFSPSPAEYQRRMQVIEFSVPESFRPVVWFHDDPPGNRWEVTSVLHTSLPLDEAIAAVRSINCDPNRGKRWACMLPVLKPLPEPKRLRRGLLAEFLTQQTGKTADELEAECVAATFGGDKFLAVELHIDNPTFRPTHPLDFPPGDYAGELDTEEYQFHTREQAIALAAERNAETLRQPQDNSNEGFSWWAIYEVGNSVSTFANFDSETGLRVSHHHELRPAVPTAIELERFTIAALSELAAVEGGA